MDPASTRGKTARYVSASRQYVGESSSAVLWDSARGWKQFGCGEEEGFTEGQAGLQGGLYKC